MTLYHVFSVVVAFAGGLVLGLVYLTLLRTGIRFILYDQRAGLGAALTVARLFLTGAGLWVAVQFGATALLGALAGFTVTRTLGTRQAKATPWI